MNCVAIYRHQLFKLSETFIHEQARTLQEFRPIYVGREISGPVPDGCRVCCVDSPGDRFSRLQRFWHSISASPSVLTRKLRHENVSIIHAHFGVEGVFALGLAKELGVPLVTTFWGFDATLKRAELLRSRKASWIRYALRRGVLANQGARFICVSRFIHQRVLELGFPADRTITHYIGVDTEKIVATAKPASKYHILHVARLVEKKGTRCLIEAFSRIAKRVPEATLQIIGEGPLRSELEQASGSLGLAGRIDFRGAQTHSMVLHAMAEASIFCLPSITAASGDAEGLPNVVLEAAASGLPTVATLHAGIPEAVMDGRTGFLVNEGDATMLAERLLILLENDELRATMGKAARAFVEQNFALKNQTRQLEEIYRSCL